MGKSGMGKRKDWKISHVYINHFPNAGWKNLLYVKICGLKN
jgi:hypothetical protein